MSTVIFKSAFSGTSKKGNPYNMVVLCELTSDGKLYEKNFFVDEPFKNISQFCFGDIVKPEFIESSYMGAPPVLVGLSLLEQSPYYKNNNKKEV